MQEVIKVVLPDAIDESNLLLPTLSAKSDGVIGVHQMRTHREPEHRHLQPSTRASAAQVDIATIQSGASHDAPMQERRYLKREIVVETSRPKISHCGALYCRSLQRLIDIIKVQYFFFACISSSPQSAILVALLHCSATVHDEISSCRPVVMAASSPVLHTLTATEALKLLQNDTITAEQYLRALLDRVDHRAAVVQAWAHLGTFIFMSKMSRLLTNQIATMPSPRP